MQPLMPCNCLQLQRAIGTLLNLKQPPMWQMLRMHSQRTHMHSS